MKVYIDLKDNKVMGWGSTPNPDNESQIEMEIDSNDEFIKNPFSYVYEDGKLIKNEQFILEKIRERKYLELDDSCKSAILGRFKITLNDIEYQFSYDAEAQSRFNGAPYLFTSGMITEIEWTAYKNGKRTSVILDKEEFDKVAKKAFEHQISNIAKFRSKIEQLNNAGIEEAKGIVW
jgi:hypothetical protein